MKQYSPQTPRGKWLCASTATMAMVAASISCAYADQTKQDNADPLDLGSSWVSGTAPGSADFAIWAGIFNNSASLTNASFTDSTPVSWGGIKVGNITGTGAGPVIIGGVGPAKTGSQVTIGTLGIDMSAANQSLVINATTNVVSGNQTWNVASGQNVRLASNSTNAANANLDGTGTITVAGAGLVDANQGGGTGTADAAGFADFSGKWIVNSGATLRGIRNGATAWGSSTAADAITLNGGTLAVGGISGAQGNWTWSTPMTLAAGTTSVIDNQIPVTTTKSRTLQLDGVITGAGNVEFRNPTAAADTTFQHVIRSTTNTYTGTTTVTAPGGGELRSVLGSVAGTKTPFGTGDVIINPGATNRNQAGGGTYAMTIPNNYKLQGGGATLEADDAYQTYTGTISLTGTNNLDTRWSDKRAIFTGVVQDGTSPGTLVKGPNGGQVYLDNVNTFTGGTTITNGDLYVRSSQGLGSGFVNLPNSAGRLIFTPITAGITSTISAIRTRRDVKLGNNVVLDVTSGNFGFNTNSGFWLQQNANGDTGKMTSRSGTLNLNTVDANGVITTGNLTTVDHQAQVALIDYGSTPVTVNKNGANSLVLNQTNTFTGGLNINAGRLNVGNARSMGNGPVVVANGASAYLTPSGATVTNNITLNGIGVTEAAGNLGALRFGSSGQTYSGTITAATPTRIHAQNGNAIVSGSLIGSANIEKTGSSQITFGGASPTFTGTLTDVEGALSFNGSMPGNLVIPDAGTVLGEGTIGGMLTIGSSTGAVIRVQGNTPAALTTTGGLTLVGVNTIQVDSVPAAPGPFTVINYAGPKVGGLANLTISGISAYRNPPVLADTGSAITLALQNGLGLTWTGASGTAWDLNTTANWTDGSPQTFKQMDSVTFNDSTTAGTVDITGQVQPSSITFNNSITEYVINGIAPGNGIVGPASIVKNGTTNVTLGGANDFTGSIAVNAGVIKMGSSNAFGRTAGITIANGGRVDINGQQPGNIATGGYTYTIAGNGPDGLGAIINSGADRTSDAGVKNIVLADNASIGGDGFRFDIGNANLAGFGTLTGNGKTLTKVGLGNVAFRGDASVNKIDIVANGGRMWAENTDLAFGGTNGTLTINDLAKAGTYGTRAIETPVTIKSGGTLYNEGGGTATWSGTITANDGALIEANNNEVRLTGALNAIGSFDKTGSNQVTVLGTATIVGDVDIQDGTLQVGDMGIIGSIGNPGSVTISNIRNADGTPGLRYRLATNATLSSPVYFATEFAELRHHPAFYTNKLTLTGPIGNSEYNGVLDVETGTMTLAGSSVSAFNSVRVKGTPNATDRGVFEISPGATLTTRYFNLGAGDRQSGIVNQYGGTVTVVSGAAGIRIGHWPNNSPAFASEYNITGGTLDATALELNAGAEDKMINVGWDGYALFNIGGGTVATSVKTSGVRLDRNRATSTYASKMTVGANAVVEIGAQGLVGQDATRTVLNGGKLVATASGLWSSPMEIAAAVGNIEVLSGVITTNTGIISGTGSLVKTGDGAMIINRVNSYTGATTVSAGALATVTGGSSSNSAVTFAGGTTHSVNLTTAGSKWTCASLAYGAGTTIEFNYGPVPPSAVIAPLLVNGNLAFNGSANIAVSGNVTTVGTYPLIKYTGTLSGTPPAAAASLPVGLVAHIVNNVANKSIDLQVTTGNVITWADSNGAWDIGTSANWKDGNNNLVAYQEGRAVQLDDSAAGTSPIAISLDTIVNPGMVTAANNTKDYSISGFGSISGLAGLTKKGTGKLTLAGTHSYTSGTLISQGTLQLGDGVANNGVVAGPIIDDGTLIFANAVDQLNSISVSGTGAVVKASSGTLTFNTRQTYTGGTVVNSGILDLTGGGGAAGTIREVVTVNSGATLRLSAGDVTGYGLVDRVHTINLNGGTMDVNIQSANGGNQTLGNATINMTGGAITGWPDGNIDFFQGESKLNTFASANSSTISGVPISPLRQGSTTFTVEDGAAAIDLDISSVIRNSPSGTEPADAVLIKAGAGTMRLSAINTLTRPIVVSAGTLLLDGYLDVGANVIVTNTGTLGGTQGTIAGDLTVESGGTFSPATNGLGVMNVAGVLTLKPGSTTKMNIDVTANLTDLVQGMSNSVYGGNLVLSIVGTPALGQSFTLFTSTAGSGNFNSITPSPGAGRSWSFDPATGAITVVQGPPTTPTTISAVINGSNLQISWPSDYLGWQLQVQENPLSVGLSGNWTAWPGSTTTTSVTVPIDATKPAVFLRLVYPPQP